MPFDRDKLIAKLEKMFWLKPDWDGFGTGPICKKALDVSIQMLYFIQVDVNVKMFVGVDPEGSVFSEITKTSNPKVRIELVVMPDGTIEYEELEEDKVLSQGGFLLNNENINEILR